MVASMRVMAGMGIVPLSGIRFLLAMAAVVHHVFHTHGARVHAAVEDGVVQGRVNAGITCHRVLDAGHLQLLVDLAAEGIAAGLVLFYPGLEVRLTKAAPL